MLDDMFERLAEADEPVDMNFVKKHALELKADGVERPAARLFSNPPVRIFDCFNSLYYSITHVEYHSG